MANIFNQHPKEVGETYFQHLWIAFKFSFTFLTTKKVISKADNMKTRKK